ncbi:MAG: transketolase [Cytophagales bacterium]|nr:MAG: transketolase [Cytophagales bacterium]
MITSKKQVSTLQIDIQTILTDYQLAYQSREASLIGRKEVFMGKAKFGIFGDGKEVAQIAMAKVFKKGDYRTGYYRDQTFMFAIEKLTLQQYFAQLYAHTSIEADPASAGRMMNGHFATRMLDNNGQWKNLTEEKNVAADLSPTASQMPKLLGLAQASKIYRNNKALHTLKNFSKKGNEIAFGTIGNASTSEGLFYETINAGGVLQIPMIVSVWDDKYGISVPQEYHTTKGSISEALAGFQRNDKQKGYEIFVVKGWDYTALCETYAKAEQIARKEHVPVIVHVVEMTQPQGHSTSGSHERYKTKERLDWEKEYDCIRQMRLWIEKNGFATPEQLDQIEQQAKKEAAEARSHAWNEFIQSMKGYTEQTLTQLQQLAQAHPNHNSTLNELLQELKNTQNAIRLDAVKALKKALMVVRNEESNAKTTLKNYLQKTLEEAAEDFNSHLYSQSEENIHQIETIKPQYSAESKNVDGREILQAFFDQAFAKDARLIAFGEDVGKIGDVNQGFAGLQEKHGEMRIFDTGIREATIIGQGIGLAMRGLKPIAEIQYLDYLLYAIQILSDDVATLQYRTRGGQKAPLIVRTRGHRLEGIWHSGSPMGMIINSLRGMRVVVPRNMTQAAAFYNTLLQSDEPALVIECLNGYRLKEPMPDNLSQIQQALGVPEILREGNDITIVTYGSMCRIVMEAAEQLALIGIECEVIDVQTLLPFDIHHSIVASIKKTNRVIFADEDVQAGATAYMMQKVIEEQNAYRWLDAAPKTISAKDHRPAYASDGDYFSKPNIENIVEVAYEMMHEAEPTKFFKLY